MAKQDDPIAKTGVSMRNSTWRDIDKIARDIGMPSRSATIEVACRLLIKHFKAGQVVIVPDGFEIVVNPVLERNTNQ